MAQVTETFANANRTLEAIDAALVTGERSLQAAERAFVSADRVLNEDMGAITADLRRLLERLDGTIATVSDDIPAITADLRKAAETVNRAFDELGEVVSASGPAMREFAAVGLPQYTRLARETRNLIANLEGLARQIERDPARFFLNRQTPEFRR
jgi:phospholipid/cholesterol/gamma-HCH transport system substrate-binding protein